MRPENSNIRVFVKNQQKRVNVGPSLIKKITSAVKGAFSANLKIPFGTITVCLVNDRIIEELNLLYLGEAAATDVLSFDIAKNKRFVVADIVISTDTAVKNAKIYKTTPAKEVLLYVVHGVLHFLGYDDNTSEKKRIMDIEANRLLSKLLCQYTKPRQLF